MRDDVQVAEHSGRGRVDAHSDARFDGDIAAFDLDRPTEGHTVGDDLRALDDTQSPATAATRAGTLAGHEIDGPSATPVRPDRSRADHQVSTRGNQQVAVTATQSAAA